MKANPLALATFSLALSLLNPVAYAAILNPQELPQTIESCVRLGTCLVENHSAHDQQNLSAFYYQNGGFSGYLFRYDLTPPSQAFNSWQQLDFNTDPPTVQNYYSHAPLSGHVWLEVAERYNSQDLYHGLTLYLENVQPSDQAVLTRNGPDNFPKTLHFGVTDSALQQGHAYHTMSLDDLTSTEQGNLSADEPLIICLAAGCGIEQQLNLIGMRFSQIGNQWVMQFNDDPRGLLYSERLYYNGIDQISNSLRAYYVQPVAVPPSAGLWLSGLVLLLATGRWSRPELL